MADTSYFRSPTRRELREQRFARKEARKNVCSVLSALDAVVKSHGVYHDPEAELTTPIPEQFLPKERKRKHNAAESVVVRQASNTAYAADVKARRQSQAQQSAKRPVSQEQPLPLSWEVTSGLRNDNRAVESKLGFTRGKGEAPAVYAPDKEQNPRAAIAAKRAEREAKKVPPPEKKPAPFEYKPSITKLERGAQPRVAELIDSAAQSMRSQLPPRRESVAMGSSIHGKPFR